jgi:hypothetical protein
MSGSVPLLPNMPSWHAQEQRYLYLLIGDKKGKFRPVSSHEGTEEE